MHKFKQLSSSRSFLGFCGFVLLLGTWLRSSDTVTAAVGEGLSLCARVVVPSLFPFFVLSNLFVRRAYHQFAAAALRPVLTPLTGLPAEAAGALALGAVGGYPIGAATAFGLYDRGRLTAQEAARLLVFCNNAGPGFVFGVVGLGIFHSLEIGLRLYLCHLLAALCCGAALHFLSDASVPRVSRPPFHPTEAEEPFPISFVEAVRDAAASMLNVCAFLVFFSVLLAFLRSTPVWTMPASLLRLLPGMNDAAAMALPDGFLELSNGIASLAAAECSEKAALSVSSFLLGWGGLCVHCQVLSLCGRREINMSPYFRGKLAQGILAAVLVRTTLLGIGILAAAISLAAAIGYFRKITGKSGAHGL